jgi:hypothetical protein
VLTVKAGCCQSPAALGFSQRFRALDQKLELPELFPEVLRSGHNQYTVDSVMTYASRLHATPFFAPHDELNTLQLLHILIMYVYIS